MAKTNNYAKNAGKPTAWDKVKDFINTGRQYQVQAIEDTATYYADRINSKKQNNFLISEANAPKPTTLGSMSYSGDPKLNAYLQSIKTNADKAVYDPRPAEKPAIFDEVKDFVNIGNKYKVQAIEDIAAYYKDAAMNRPRVELGSMSPSGDPEFDAYLQDINLDADRAVYDPRPAEKPAILNEAKNLVNTAVDKTKDFINTGREYQVKAIEDMTDYYAERAMNKPKTDDTWFQSGAFSDGWQRGDLRNAAKATLADLNMNMTSGALRLGENAADSTRMLGAWSYGGLMPSEEMSIYPVYSFSLDAREAEKQRAADFVAKDLIDEDAIAETLYADYLARNPDLDVGRDSILGTKSRVLAKEAGELAAVTALQAVGVPWWLTTGVNAFGNEAEHAAKEGATFDEAATSGLISAGAEIFTEAISKGLKDGGWSLSDKAAQKISTLISDDFVNSAIRFGLKSFEGGAENAVVWAMEKFGQWLSYQDEKTLREVLASDEARKELSIAFWSGLMLEGVPKAVDSAFGKKDLMAQMYDWGRGYYTPYLPPHN